MVLKCKETTNLKPLQTKEILLDKKAPSLDEALGWID